MPRSSISLPPSAPDGLSLSRDGAGVLHVCARRLADLYWGMGYAHASDRGLQLLLTRILGQGRGSECLDNSDAMLEVDCFFRRMNWAGNLDDEVGRLDGETLEICESYCAGINAALDGKGPWELRLLGYRPEAWKTGDSLLLMRLIGWIGLAQSQGEIERLFVELVQAGVSDERVDDLFPGALAEVRRDLLERVQLGERLVPEALTWLQAAPRAMASNNWVVAPERSASGHALLANDPHLEVNRLPSVWQELVLELPGRYLICGTMPGIPAAILGRTRELSWGVTYAFMDAVDSWIEDCRDGCYRRGEDEWIPFAVRRESIVRKKKETVELTLWENDHGVLDGDPREPGLYLSRRWSAGSGGARSLNAARRVFESATVAEGMAVLGEIETAWSWVLADSDGNIGFQMSGLMPLRREGVSGLAPLPGWLPENDWQGFAGVEELPRVVNPPVGYIVTANQDLNHLGLRKPINAAMGNERANRIAQLLEEKPKLDLEDFKAIQYDLTSLQARTFIAALGDLIPEGPSRDELLGWDCRYDCDSLVAGLFEDFYTELRRRVFGARGVGSEVVEHLLCETGVFNDFYDRFDTILLSARSAWWEGLDRDEVVRESFLLAAGRPRERWGKRNSIPLSHILFGGKLPGFLGFDRGPIELPGGRATPHQGQVFRSGGRQTSFAPSLRILVDMGSDVLHSNLPGGPSDRRFSKWYASDLGPWLRGEYKRLAAGDGSPD